MKKIIEFQMDAREFGVAEAEVGDLVLVTIDTEKKLLGLSGTIQTTQHR